MAAVTPRLFRSGSAALPAKTLAVVFVASSVLAWAVVSSLPDEQPAPAAEAPAPPAPATQHAADPKPALEAAGTPGKQDVEQAQAPDDPAPHVFDQVAQAPASPQPALVVPQGAEPPLSTDLAAPDPPDHITSADKSGPDSTGSINLPPEAAQPTPAPEKPQQNEAAAPPSPPESGLVARADQLIARGDITSARLWLKTASDAGDREATFKLAQTYDPAMLAKWGVVGMTSDPALAQDLYKRAGAPGPTSPD